jgi:hypothetical protein
MIRRWQQALGLERISRVRRAYQHVLASVLMVTLVASTSESTPDLTGTYLFLLRTVTVTKLPVLKDYVARTQSVALVQLRHEGTNLRGEGPVCSVSIRGSSNFVRTEIPDAFVRSLAKAQVAGTLTRTPNGLNFSQGNQALVVGAKLKNPSSEPLPRDANDSRVYDQDQDGNPGVTVKVSGLVSGKVFLSQRSTSSLTGHQTATGFAGSVKFRVEQQILGATHPFLKGNHSGAPSAEGSFFRLEKLPSSAGCTQAEALGAQFWNAKR